MKRLVVVYDVSEFSDEEVGNLEFAAVVQAEAEIGDYAHPDARTAALIVSDPIGVEALDALVDLTIPVGTWPTADEMRAEGRDPDTGLMREES